MSDKVHKSWENFLDPEVLHSNLIVASIYIAAFELLKNAIVDRIKDFYTIGFDEKGPRIGPEYQSDVLVRDRSPVYASLGWLKESRAIADDDVAVFDSVKKLRNELAHALTRMLWEGLVSDLATRFKEMVSLLEKIERWWIVNVELPISPEFHGEQIQEEGVVPGPIMGLRLMLDIALGSEEESKKYINEFLRRTPHP